MTFDINTIKEKLNSDNQFCLDFYRHIHSAVIREDYVDDVDGKRLSFGKRTGIEIIRHYVDKAEASFQFKCTYDKVSRMEGMGHPWVNLDDKTRLYPIVTVVARYEALVPIDKIGKDIKQYYKANALYLHVFDSNQKVRDNFNRELFFKGIEVVFGDEVLKVNTLLKDKKLLHYN